MQGHVSRATRGRPGAVHRFALDLAPAPAYCALEREDVMTKGRAVKRAEGLVGGGILMLLGTLFLLDQLDLYEFRRIWTWWALFPLGFGLARLAGAEDHAQRRSGAWLTVMGAWMLINTQGWFGFTWRNSWPLLLIAFGVLMTWQALA